MAERHRRRSVSELPGRMISIALASTAEPRLDQRWSVRRPSEERRLTSRATAVHKCGTEALFESTVRAERQSSHSLQGNHADLFKPRMDHRDGARQISPLSPRARRTSMGRDRSASDEQPIRKVRRSFVFKTRLIDFDLCA